MDCNGTAQYSFTTEIRCDETYDKAGEVKVNKVVTDKCEIYLDVSHKAGCPVSSWLWEVP